MVKLYGRPGERAGGPRGPGWRGRLVVDEGRAVFQGPAVAAFPGSPDEEKEVAREGSREPWRDGERQAGRAGPVPTWTEGAAPWGHDP